jgi:hypothetical protein
MFNQLFAVTEFAFGDYPAAVFAFAKVITASTAVFFPLFIFFILFVVIFFYMNNLIFRYYLFLDIAAYVCMQ